MIVRSLAIAMFMTAAACGPSARRAADAPAVDPDRFVFAEGQFSAIFPGAPQHTQKQVETEAGTFTIHEVGVAILTPGELGAYSVSYADMPPKLNMIETMRSIVRKPPRVLLSEKEVAIGQSGTRGLELVYEEGDLEKTGRFLQIGPRYFQILVEYPKGKKPTGTRTFLESFELR